MRAAFIRSTGDPSVIEYGEWPRPVAGPRDVLVRVEAAALDHVDLLVRAGCFDPGLRFPYVLGRDAVGVVEDAGADVHRFTRGDRVWSHCLGLHGRPGAFAELIAVRDDALFQLPAGLDPLVSAALA